jgi:hypothetical protein
MLTKRAQGPITKWAWVKETNTHKVQNKTIYNICVMMIVIQLIMQNIVPVSKHHSNEPCTKTEVIAPRALNLGNKRRWMVRCRLRPHYTKRNIPWYPLYMLLSAVQSPLKRGCEEKSRFSYLISNPSRPVSSSQRCYYVMSLLTKFDTSSRIDFPVIW